jgi:hypothetical protein
MLVFRISVVTKIKESTITATTIPILPKTLTGNQPFFNAKTDNITSENAGNHTTKNTTVLTKSNFLWKQAVEPTKNHIIDKETAITDNINIILIILFNYKPLLSIFGI